MEFLVFFFREEWKRSRRKSNLWRRLWIYFYSESTVSCGPACFTLAGND